MRCLKLLTGDVHSSSNNRKKRNPHQETISCPSPNAAARHFCSGAGSCCSGSGSSRVATRNRRSPSDRAGAARIEAVPEEHRHGTWHPSPRICCLRAHGDAEALPRAEAAHRRISEDRGFGRGPGTTAGTGTKVSPGNERGAGQGEELCLGQIGERIEMVLCSRQTSETTYLHICSSPKEMTNALRTSRCPSCPLPSSHREMPPGLLWVSTDQEGGPRAGRRVTGKGPTPTGLC